MAITYEAVRDLTANLYEWSLKRIPDDTKLALEAAIATETNDGARKVLAMMRRSADRAENTDRFVCSDSGVPVYFIKIGSGARFEGDVKRAIKEGFARLVETIEPPILKHVTNPLTLERSHAGKDMPIITWDVIDGADYIDITCAPKALGSGRWADLEIFSFPSLEEIEKYILEVVVRSGSQQCPPVVVGVGIGGTFDYCTKLAKMATLRPMGSVNPEPMLADMEERLLKAINRLGFGPMGTGGDTTALAIHIDYASGHGFTPVAVCFNCWINRRTRARLYNDGHVERVE
ncbi:fumarate hydratase [Pseudochelatococcus sp. B33]